MSINDLNINNYRAVRSTEASDSLLLSVDAQRKAIFLLQDSSSKSLDNISSCELLKQKLEEYSDKVIENGKSIYTNLLEKNNPNIKDEIRFKTNPSVLENLDISAFVKEFGCQGSSKFYCKESESITDAEFNDFCTLYSPVQKRTEKTLEVVKKPVMQESNKKDIGAKRSHDYSSHFKTAKDELNDQALTKYASNPFNNEGEDGSQRSKSVGLRRRTVKSKFVSPLLSRSESSEDSKAQESVEVVDKRLKNIEPKMVELIRAEIMDHGSNIQWDDIAGLKQAKTAIQEAVVWPMLRPDIFTGLRRPPRGILLFGPPGTGKTLIAKCVASQSQSTFFSISASSLTSKWIGDGEKMVRALFVVARVHQPAVIFIDEVDSLLTQRSDTEHESSRRIKTEFLVHLDGAATNNEDRILLIGATNRPQELDEAARRRFVKRLYIPLPEYEARLQLLHRLINNERHDLSEEDFKEIANISEGYSGADIQNLCCEASLEPIRSIDFGLIQQIQAHEVRPLNMQDFESAFKRIRPSVSQSDLTQYIVWNDTYGSGGHTS